MFNKDLKKHLNHKISSYFNEEQDVISATEVHGGSINNCYQVKTSKNIFFIKINDAEMYPEMFETESKGLELLKSTNSFRIPEVYFTGRFEEVAFILMEYISTGSSKNKFWKKFASSLAKLHRNSADNFGLDHDNYIGSLPQYNEWKESWSDFFIENRLLVQQKLARDSNKIDSDTSQMLDKLYPRVEDLFPTENPSLLHGDLWSGNFMADGEAKPVVIDPAVYYGHREMDIAMSRLFGGYDREMYTTYQTEFPMEQGWEERMGLCNLYPLMAHVNLFGGGYVQQVDHILKRFV